MLPRLDPLEIHAGLVCGPRRSPPPPPAAPLPGGPREVLDSLLLDALAEPPCQVMFSGGRDSSLILAAATAAAHSHGLPKPIPLTARFQGHTETQEDDWQERVVRHLDLDEWHRFELTDELDALGPVATDALTRFGLFWPSNAHTMAVFARHATGGTILTGGGGDELFSPWFWRRPTRSDLLGTRPRRRIVTRAGFAALPLPLRQRIHARRTPVRLGWLRPAGEERLNKKLRRDEAAGPSWAQEMEEYVESRYLECIRSALDTFCRDAGVRLIEPFYDARMIRAVVSRAPTRGFPSRTRALEQMLPGLLPDDVLRRGSKATFTNAMVGPALRRFAEAWNGEGLDEDLVDPRAVRSEWLRPVPDGRAMCMLHYAWLRSDEAQNWSTAASS